MLGKLDFNSSGKISGSQQPVDQLAFGKKGKSACSI